MGNKSSEIALEIVKYHTLWSEMDKEDIISNLEKILYLKFPESAKSFNAKMQIMMEISGSKKDAVYSWFNRGRKKHKPPFIKLCEMAIALETDISEFLK